jgi:NAD(P)-dependent dehydrogenase (short-subunit alcohol dehydrogenase family)
VNSNITSFVSDFLEPPSVDNLVKHVKSTFDFLDILINNAGVFMNRSFQDITREEENVMMEVNFHAPSKLIRDLNSIMRPRSHIVNIGSMGGFQGSVKFNGLSVYCASKAALSSLSECLAAEFAEQGISVNCLAPGSVQTEMLSKAFPGYKAGFDAADMGRFVAEFALTGHKYFNGKVLPISVSTP